MRRLFLYLILLCCLLAPAWGQRRGGFARSVGGYSRGSSYGYSRGASLDFGYGNRPFYRGAYGYGYPYQRFGYGYGRGFGLGVNFGGFYGYSPYYSGYSAYSYYDYAPPVAVYAPPPPTVVYQTLAPATREIIREREYVPAPSVESSQAGSTLYLIAMQDGSVVTALAAWVEGDRVNYISRAQQKRDVPLGQIDRALTDRLNRERGVTLRLP